MASERGAADHNAGTCAAVGPAPPPIGHPVSVFDVARFPLCKLARYAHKRVLARAENPFLDVSVAAPTAPAKSFHARGFAGHRW